MNALTDSEEPIVKEVGPAGTLEHILELLQIRFGNKLRLDTFHAELKRRKRDPDESLQDLYLDLCRLRTLASGKNSDEKYPGIYFRNIFVDALGDRELRRAVLIQNPSTMEAAYNVATRLETIYAYETPLRDRSCRKQIDLENKNLESPMQMTGRNADGLARRIEELEGALQSMQMMAGTHMQASYLSIESSINESIQLPVRSSTSEVTGGQTYGERSSRKILRMCCLAISDSLNSEESYVGVSFYECTDCRTLEVLFYDDRDPSAISSEEPIRNNRWAPSNFLTNY